MFELTGRAATHVGRRLWTAPARTDAKRRDSRVVELAVRPDDLHAAAVALSACARRLEDAQSTFAAAAAREVPELGREAVEAAGVSATRAQRAVSTIAEDIDQLARALRLLAHVYAEVDRQAVHG